MSPRDGSQATRSECADLLAIALSAAHSAAATIRRFTARDIVWQEKSQRDFVSDVDLAAEHALREIIGREIPNARVIGEELSPNDVVGDASGDITFIVDPLDGTTNFLHGFPWYAVSVAVMVRAMPAAGVVINIPTGDVASAAVGGGTRFNDALARVSSIDEPARALIGTGFPFKTPERLPEYAAQFMRVTRATAGIRRAGSAALDLTDVALGRFDAFWELTLASWDYAAGAILVRESGGLISTVEGSALDWGTSSILAGNPRMHAWLLEALRASSDLVAESPLESTA